MESLNEPVVYLWACAPQNRNKSAELTKRGLYVLVSGHPSTAAGARPPILSSPSLLPLHPYAPIDEYVALVSTPVPGGDEMRAFAGLTVCRASTHLANT